MKKLFFYQMILGGTKDMIEISYYFPSTLKICGYFSSKGKDTQFDLRIWLLYKCVCLGYT